MKYRKKPVLVEAYQTKDPIDIETLEGTMHASSGDYIITGVNGEKYPSPTGSTSMSTWRMLDAARSAQE